MFLLPPEKNVKQNCITEKTQKYVITVTTGQHTDWKNNKK
jgi:hypothetical protein